MYSKKQNLVLIILFAILIGGFSILNLVLPETKYSNAERRVLAELPELSRETLKTGEFMKKFETYTQDQFPLRNSFRSLKANTLFRIFMQKDNNGLYAYNGYLSKLEYPLNEDLLKGAGEKFTAVYEKYLKGTSCKAYLSIIPDKNCFLAPVSGHVSMDYDKAISIVRENSSFASYIDITPTLSLDNFYLTDQHWKQETIIPTAETLLQGMGATAQNQEEESNVTAQNLEKGLDVTAQNQKEISSDKLDITKNYKNNKLEKPFYGAYYDQLALKGPSDELYYLTSPIFDKCTVTSYNTGKAKVVPFYDMEKANGRDPYEMYLNGSDALLTIENPSVTEKKELVIFRDSFGSTITPFFVPYYSKITLVDLRYIKSDYIGAFVTFDNQDVLFLYSTLLLNHSTGLQ